MTPQRFQEIRGVFESLVALPISAQVASLREIGDRDPELAAEIDALLAAHGRRGSFIESPAARLPEDGQGSQAPAAGTHWAGPYRLLDLIGEGGMGQVWRAQQTEPVQRVVAVKLIKFGMDSREVINRFQSERQALALMEHPAIAKVFDAGTTAEGRPYIAMEYVNGLPVTDYCARHRLPLRQRLSLFLRVCEGVQHAHQKAVIHRDLKPSNILVTEVDGKPVPKIIDFGVARATSQDDPDATMLTRLGAILGTPDYMSPEQASAGAQDIDTRADVYSLGVVLYEVLTGALPFDLRGLPFGERLRRVAEADAPLPSARLRMPDMESAEARSQSERAALISQLRGDLDAIVLKAIEKDRRLRYASPADLAADIDRHLHNEPVIAQPASALYFARKYVMRHRATVAVGLILLTLIVSFAIWQRVELRRITRERDRADRIARFMSDMFRISDPSESRGNQVTARQILDRASADIGNGLKSDPELQAQLMNVMGRVYLRLGLFSQAELLLRRCAETTQGLFGPDSLQTAQALNDLGNVLSATGRRTEAERIDEQVLAIRKRRLGAGHPDTLKSMNNLAVDMVEAGRYPDAERLQRRVFDARRRMAPEDPATLRIMSNLGDTLSREGKLSEAEALERTALQLRRRILGRDHPDTLESLHHLGDTLYNEGRYGEAEEVQRELLEARKRVLGPDHRQTLTAMLALANPLENQGRLAESEKLNRLALEAQLRILGPEHPDTMLAMNNLAGVLAEEAKFSEAEKLDREALAIRVRVFGLKHAATLVSSNHLAFVLMLKGSFAEAEDLARKTLDLQIKLVGAQSPEPATTSYTLACIAAHTGRRAEALSLLQDSVDHGLRPNAALGIGKDPALKPLHGEPRFRDLVNYARHHAEVSIHQQ